MIDERTVFLYTEKEALAQFSCWFQERHTLRESKEGIEAGASVNLEKEKDRR